MNVSQAINIHDLRRLAERHAPRAVFDFMVGGADDEIGLHTNEEAFRSVRFIPRYGIDTSQRSLTTRLFGTDWAAPFGVAPTGVNGLYRSGADLYLAQASRDADIPFTMSNASNASIEQAVAISPRNTFFQLYGTHDRTLMRDTVRRVADLGVTTLFLTIDTPVHSKRERNIRSGFGIPPQLKLSYLIEAMLHPAWLIEYFRGGGMPRMENVVPPARSAGMTALELAQLFAQEAADCSQTWHDVESVRRQWPGTLVIKGLMHPEDARRAEQLGADGIVVSNHGGRQLDRATSSLYVLPAIRRAVGARLPVMIDGGVLRGSDVVAAMCLGASFVFIGRATLYGAVAGRLAGARRAIEILRDEVDRTMAQLGVNATSEFGTHLLDTTLFRPLSRVVEAPER